MTDAMGPISLEQMSVRCDRSGNRLTQTATDYAFDDAGAYAVQYTYDAASNRKTLTDPQNASTSYVYDVLNRLKTLTSPAGQFRFHLRCVEPAHPDDASQCHHYDIRLQSGVHASLGAAQELRRHDA